MGAHKDNTVFSRWVTLVACIGMCMMYPMSFSTAGLFLIRLGPYFGMGSKTVTWVAACQSGVGGASGVMAGLCIRRFGPRRVGFFATVVTVGGLLLGALVDSIYVLYVSFGVMFGMGSITFCLLGLTTGFRRFPNNKALVSGVLATFISVGGFFWAPMIELIIEYFTWKGALVIMAGIHLHCFIFSLLLEVPQVNDTTRTTKEDSCTQSKELTELGQCEKLLNERQPPLGNIIKKTRPHEQDEPSGKVSQARSDEKKQSRELDWRITGPMFLLATCLQISCHMNFYTYMPALNEQLGFSTQQGALLLSVVNICSAVVRLPAGLFGNLKLVSCSCLYGLAAVAAALLSMTSLLSSSYTALLILCAFYGVSAGFYMSLQGPSILENVPQKYLEIAMGLNHTLQGLSIFLLHGTAGFILDAVGDSHHLFFIFGSCGLISGFLALTLVIAKFCYRRSHKSDCIEAIAVIPDQKHNAKVKV